MTPQQKARLLRARAATLRVEATLFETIIAAELNGALIQTRIVEAVELEAVAAELEEQAKKEAESVRKSANPSCATCGHGKLDHSTLGITGTQNCRVQMLNWKDVHEQCRCGAFFLPDEVGP